MDLSLYDMKRIKPLIMDSIIDVYGEKYRHVISDRLDTIHIDLYSSNYHLECLDLFSQSLTEEEKQYLNTNSAAERVKKLGLLSKPDFEFLVGNEIAPHPVNYPTGRIVNGKAVPFNLVLLPINYDSDIGDIQAIHEILHAVESSIVFNEDGSFDVKTGLDSFHDEPGHEDTSSEDEKRPFELLNENIHQELSIMVTDNIHSKGIYLFDNPEKSRTATSMTYERFDGLTGKFRETFLPEIIDGIMSPTFDTIYSSVGKGFLENLGNIVNEYASIIDDTQQEKRKRKSTFNYES